MILQLTNKCPKCGKADSVRIPKKWYMRLIPFTKLYHCHNCGNDYLVNFLAMILLMPIIIPITFIIWALWDLTGLRFFWQKIRPPVDSSQHRRPASTFSIWVTGIFVVYLILFNFASQRFESRIEIIENKVNSTLSLLTVTDIDVREDALSKISKIQNMTLPDKPNIYEPMSIFRTFFKPADHKYEEMKDLLSETIARFKGHLDSVNLERADLRNADLKEAEPNNVDLSVSNLINAYIRDANLTNSELKRANLRGAVLVE
jgi:hypothetical protein